MKKTTMSGFAGIAAAALLAAVGLAPSANAQIVLTAGDFTIYLNGYTSDNLYSGGLPPPDSGANGGLLLSGGQLEDTWGIFQVTRITQVGAVSDLFNDNLGTEYWGMLYGSYDTAQGFTGLGNLEAVSTGLTLDVYEHTVNDTSNSLFTAVALQGTSGRTGLTTYTGINSGSSVFSATLAGSMFSTFYPANGTSSATGNLAVLPGQTLFNTGGLAFSLINFIISGESALDISGANVDWNLKVTGTASGNIVPVPEPSTYGLVAAGALLGLVAFRRMKVRAQAV